MNQNAFPNLFQLPVLPARSESLKHYAVQNFGKYPCLFAGKVIKKCISQFPLKK